MAGVAAFLWCVAVSDLVRTSQRGASKTRLGFAAGIGLAFGALWCWWLDTSRAGTWAWVAGALCLIFWISVSAVALHTAASRRCVTAAGVVAAISLVGGLVAMLVAGDVAGTWPTFDDISWADPPDAAAGGLDRLLLVSALLAVQLSTANILVRMLLSAAGVPAESNEDEVKGGRWLGPMERIFILGFGAAGEFTAASAVVAAKALLRLPEVNNSDEPAPDQAHDQVQDQAQGGTSPGGATTGATAEPSSARSRLAEHSEYLLLGSFASWLVAAASIALTLVPS